MTLISPLENILIKGLFGNYEDKNENDLLTIKEIKKLTIVQIVKYKNSSLQIEDFKIEGLTLPSEPLKVNYNNDSRILWNGPKNWLFVSKKKNILNEIKKIFNANNFAITDLSHSRSIIEIEGNNAKEILKKGCPLNINELKKNNSVNSIFNGITLTIDMINDNPNIIRLFVLRSFGESFYESISDASLEYGYNAK